MNRGMDDEEILRVISVLGDALPSECSVDNAYYNHYYKTLTFTTKHSFPLGEIEHDWGVIQYHEEEIEVVGVHRLLYNLQK